MVSARKRAGRLLLLGCCARVRVRLGVGSDFDVVLHFAVAGVLLGDLLRSFLLGLVGYRTSEFNVLVCNFGLHIGVCQAWILLQGGLKGGLHVATGVSRVALGQLG